MSFNLGTKINNLYQLIEELNQNTVSNPLTGDLNANNNKIINAESIELNNNTVSTNAQQQLTVNGVPITTGGGTVGTLAQVLQAGTDANNQPILNVSSLTVSGSITQGNQPVLTPNKINQGTGINIQNNSGTLTVNATGIQSISTDSNLTTTSGTMPTIGLNSDVVLPAGGSLSINRNSGLLSQNDLIEVWNTAGNGYTYVANDGEIGNWTIAGGEPGYSNWFIQPSGNSILSTLTCNTSLTSQGTATFRNIVNSVPPVGAGDVFSLTDSADDYYIQYNDSGSFGGWNKNPNTPVWSINKQGNISTSGSIVASDITASNSSISAQNAYISNNVQTGSITLNGNVVANRVQATTSTAVEQLAYLSDVNSLTLNDVATPNNGINGANGIIWQAGVNESISITANPNYLTIGSTSPGAPITAQFTSGTIQCNSVNLQQDNLTLTTAIGGNKRVYVQGGTQQETIAYLSDITGSGGSQNIQQVLTTGNNAGQKSITNLNNVSSVDATYTLTESGNTNTCSVGPSVDTAQIRNNGLEIICDIDNNISSQGGANLIITDKVGYTQMGFYAHENNSYIASSSSVLRFLDANFNHFAEVNNSQGLVLYNYSQDGQQQIINSSSLNCTGGGQLETSSDLVIGSGNLVLATNSGATPTSTNLSQIYFGSTALGQGKIYYDGTQNFTFYSGGNQLLNVGDNNTLTFGNPGMGGSPKIQISGIPLGGGPSQVGTVYDSVFNPPTTIPYTLVPHSFVSGDTNLTASDFFKLHTFTGQNNTTTYNINLPNTPTGLNVGDFIDITLIPSISSYNFVVKGNSGLTLANLSNVNQCCRFIVSYIDNANNIIQYVSNSGFTPASTLSLYNINNDSTNITNELQTFINPEKEYIIRIKSDNNLDEYQLPNINNNIRIKFKSHHTSQSIKLVSNSAEFYLYSNDEIILRYINNNWEMI